MLQQYVIFMAIRLVGGSLHIQDIHPELHEKFNLVMLQDRGGYRRQGSGFIGGKIWEGPTYFYLKS